MRLTRATSFSWTSCFGRSLRIVLEDFLVRNWKHTELGKELALYNLILNKKFKSDKKADFFLSEVNLFKMSFEVGILHIYLSLAWCSANCFNYFEKLSPGSISTSYDY